MKRPFLIFIPALIGIVGLSHSKLAFSDELAQKIKERLDDDLNIENSIKCSPEIRVAHPGEIFECEIIDPQGRTHYLDAEIVDFLGGFEILSRSE